MKMRIVGMNNSVVFVQLPNMSNEWVQIKLTTEEFKQLMKSSFPKHFAEYVENGGDKSIHEWAYHYGETEDMIAKGKAYIFTE